MRCARLLPPHARGRQRLGALRVRDKWVRHTLVCQSWEQKRLCLFRGEPARSENGQSESGVDPCTSTGGPTVPTRRGPATGPGRTPRRTEEPGAGHSTARRRQLPVRRHPVVTDVSGARRPRDARPGPLWPGEPEHPRRRLRKHEGSVRKAMRLRAEDYRWRSGEVGRRTRRARERRLPAPARARQAPGGAQTPGHIPSH